jgi:hypothetical protein
MISRLWAGGVLERSPLKRKNSGIPGFWMDQLVMVGLTTY